MRKLYLVLLSFLLALTSPVLSELLSLDSPNAFRLPRPDMNSAELADFNYGRGFFRHEWSALENLDNKTSGLGPLFNANACSACHVRDGRGRPPDPGSFDATSFVMALSAGSKFINGYAEVLPDPVYGFQLQDRAINGVTPEGRIEVSYEESIEILQGGEIVSLRYPSFSIVEAGYGPFSEQLQLGPRVAPPIIGLGLLASIPEEDLLALQDIDDADNDGISGRINPVVSIETEELVAGRFGWKLTAASVLQQSQRAASADMGLSSQLKNNVRGDCTNAQIDCFEKAMEFAPGEGLDFGVSEMRLLAFYASNLQVPPARDIDNPDVIAGKGLFIST